MRIEPTLEIFLRYLYTGMMKKHLLLFLLIFTQTFVVRASHIVGGDIYYDYLGNNQYRFNVSIYRDGLSTGAGFDNPLNLTVYYASGAQFNNYQIPYLGHNVVPVVFNNPCVTPPTNLMTENAIYTIVVTLPPVAGGYNVSYQRCCRGPNITNLVFPEDQGFTLTCHVPTNANNFYINSSARFNDYPPQLLCNNEDLIFDHSASDADGDVLVYSLVTPNQGASDINPAPNSAPPPPYASVVWAGGFSATTALGPGATINIDANTGLLTASPNLTGLFVVGIQVDEYRNGVLINSMIRDFLFKVFNCNLQLEAVLPIQEDLPSFNSYCDGLTVDFVNNSYGGTNYQWDFGVLNDNTDVSTNFAPTFTYPANGSYTAMLVVNPGWPCTDTAFMNVIVNNVLDVSFTSNDSLCIIGNSFDFVGSTSGPAGTTFEWDFGPNANTQIANTQNVNGINFNQSGHIPVTLEVTFSQCVSSYTDSVFLFDEPVANMIIPTDVECNGLTIDFGNSSQNAINYAWNFGDPTTLSDTSDLLSPTYTFQGPGLYLVSLTASSSPSCSDTDTVTIEINDPILLSFSSQDSMCITNNSFNFDGTVSGPPLTAYSYDFTAAGNPSTSNLIDVNNVSFTNAGSVPITLTGTHNNCTESITQNIYLYAEPTVDFDFNNGLLCAPFPAQFNDLSTSETGLSYLWDFGDGTTSTEQNPNHVFSNSGNYSVSLTISTSSGCVNTLFEFKPDYITVNPSPVSDFSVTPSITDICHSRVQFNDLSSDATEFYYWFDDSVGFSIDQNPSHLYLNDGGHHPTQIVTNSFGCKDTSRQYIYIEPFTFYAPNTFTPDGNIFNQYFKPIVYFDVPEWNLKIYNRWGELIFETLNIDEGWDGTTPTGVLASDGIYIWKATYISCEPNNPEKIVTGHVSLIR